MKSSTQQQAAKAIAAVMAASLAFATPAGAAPAGDGIDAQQPGQSQQTGTIRTGFPDVPATHWALKYITQLGMLDAVQGDEHGRFNPEDEVSRQDAIIMVVRMMGLEQEALALDAGSTALTLDVRQDAKPYIILALQQHLLDMQEEQNDGSPAKWGDGSATREWITKIIVRGLGKQADAEQTAGLHTTFNDDSSISDWALGYVNTAVAINLVKGFEEDNTFRPKEPVQRAQMATLLGRAEQGFGVSYARVVSGYVENASADSITITDAHGTTRQYRLNAQTFVYGPQSEETRLTVDALKTGNQVYLIHNGGSAYFVDIVKETTEFESYEGILQSVDVPGHRLSMIENGSEQVYDLAAATIVTNVDGGGGSLAALQKGTTIEVKRSTFRPDKYTHIVIKKLPINKTGVEATVEAVRTDERVLVVNEKDGGAAEYPISADVVIKWKGAIFPELNQLHARDSITFDVNANEVTAIEVTQQYVEPVDEGKFVSADTKNALLTIKHENGKPVAYYYTNDVEVHIEGMPYATLSDLLPDDHLKLDLDPDNADAIKKITVGNRSIRTDYMASVVHYSADDKLLTVKVNGKGQAFDIDEKTQLDNNGAAVSLSNFAAVLTAGKKVDLTVSNDKNIIKIAVSVVYEGTVTQMNPITREFAVETAGKQQLKLKLAPGAKFELINVKDAKITDVQVGSRVKVTFTASQDGIALVQSKNVVTGRVVSKDSNSRNVTIKDDQGAVASYPIDTTTVIAGKDNLTVLSWNEISADEPIQLAVLGAKIDKAVISRTVRGPVIAADVLSGKLSLFDNLSSRQIDITLGEGDLLRGTDGTALTLGALKAQERVEAVHMIDGTYRVSIGQSLEGDVVSYDAAKKQLKLKTVTEGETATYALSAASYNHQGSKSFNPNFLIGGTRVQVHLIEGKVVELEKL